MLLNQVVCAISPNVLLNDTPGEEAWKLQVGEHGVSLQRRHNEHNSDSNHQPHDCLVNHLLSADQRNIKAPRHWPLWAEFTGDRWIPHTNGQ